MNWKFRFAALLLVVDVANAEVPPFNENLGPALPFMASPFDGEYNTGGVFDHVVKHRTDEKFQLAFWGERVRGAPKHRGYDWSLPMKTPVKAVASGTILHAGVDEPFVCNINDETVTNQISVQVLHQGPDDRFYMTRYAHLSGVDVQEGDAVEMGQLLGLSGSSGCSSGPHLHFEVWMSDYRDLAHARLVDPYGWSSNKVDPWGFRRRPSPHLWLESEAPTIMRQHRIEGKEVGALPIQLTGLRSFGENDWKTPNNELVHITYSPQPGHPSVLDLTGYTLRNNAGDTFEIPRRTRIRAGGSQFIATGTGRNNAYMSYLNLAHPIWNDQGDCAHLIGPSGEELDSIPVPRAHIHLCEPDPPMPNAGDPKDPDA